MHVRPEGNLKTYIRNKMVFDQSVFSGQESREEVPSGLKLGGPHGHLRANLRVNTSDPRRKQRKKAKRGDLRETRRSSTSGNSLKTFCQPNFFLAT